MSSTKNEKMKVSAADDLEQLEQLEAVLSAVPLELCVQN